MMTTERASSIPEGVIDMLRPLSWDNDNKQSIFDTLKIKNHALSVVLEQWQLTEHASYLRDI